MGRPSTRRTRLSRAWPLDQVDAETIAALAKRFGVAGGRRARERLEARLDDRAVVRDALAKAPPLALVALEALAEMGDEVGFKPLVHLVERRSGASRWRVVRALDAVVETGLVVALAGRHDPAPTHLALLEPAAKHVAELLAGATLPDAPETLPADATPPLALRDLLVVATLAAHRRARVTCKGPVSRQGKKSFGRDLGREPDEVMALLDRALLLGLAGAVGEEVVPRREALEAAARGAILGDGRAAACARAWLSRPVSEEAFVRACARVGAEPLLPRHFAPLHGPGDQGRKEDAIRAELAHVPGLWHGLVGGVAVVAPMGLVGAAKGPVGYVTPSFEVLLEPNADLELVVRIGLGAELVRLDRLLTFRLTRASVTSGLSLGLDADELLEALARASARELPQNVAQTVRDWAANSRVARVMEGRFLFAGREAAEALRAAGLPALAVAEVVPGVFWLRDNENGRALEATCARAGVRARVVVGRDPRAALPFAAPGDVTAFAVPPEPPLPLTPRGDPELRARIRAGAESGFAATGADGAREEEAAMDRQMEQACAELAAWCERLPARVRPPAPLTEALQANATLVAALAVLDDEARARCLKEARDLDDLLERLSERLAIGGSVDRRHAELVVRAFQEGFDSLLEEAWDELDDADDADDADDDADDADDDADDDGDPWAHAPPAPEEFIPLGQEQIDQALRDAIRSGQRVFLLMGPPAGGPAEVVSALVFEVRRQGNAVMVLGEDLATGEDRAWRRDSIRSVRIDDEDDAWT